MRTPMIPEEPPRIVRTPMGRPSLRCVLLSGGNAAGKTTLFDWGKARVNGARGYVWHSETGGPSLSRLSVAEAYDLALQQWTDPTIHTLVVEGTRVYSTIFKTARDHYDVGRALWVLQLLQTPDVGRAHLRARCAAKGKKYRSDYWEKEELDYQFAERYEAALRKFLPMPRGPHQAPYDWEPPLGERLTLWVELGHGNLGPAYTWFAKALGVPIVVRTPMRIDRAAEAGGATA